MSFTTEVKSEISQNELKECCQRAQLSALVKMCSTLTFSSLGMVLVIKTENATIAKRTLKMLKEQFDVETELSVLRKMNLKKNYIYQIRVLSHVKQILDELGIWTDKGLQEHPAYLLVKKDCCARAYLAGSFMAAGSVNAPTKANYHMEIACMEESHAIFIQKLMARFGLPTKIIERRKHFIVYCKQADKIADFLRCIAASEALMKFEDIRITRDFRNNLTRLDNCELANEVKTIAAATKQVDDITLLKEVSMLDHMDEKFKVVGYMRLSHPEASLTEMTEIYEAETGQAISKSGMKHRLKKLTDLAEDIRKRQAERASMNQQENGV